LEVEVKVKVELGEHETSLWTEYTTDGVEDASAVGRERSVAERSVAGAGGGPTF
jgi:hypothetical protein